VDLISASAHKVYGPKGVGALIARRRDRRRPPLAPLLYGGGQEHGLRPGTLPVPLIAGFGEASRLAVEDGASRTQRCMALRRQVLDGLAELQATVIGDQTAAIPHIVCTSLLGVDADAAILVLKPIAAVSKGSACTSARQEPSHVLSAMGVSGDVAQGALRLSWSHLTPDPDIPGMVLALAGIR
jgi:cysteine desulfurase